MNNADYLKQKLFNASAKLGKARQEFLNAEIEFNQIYDLVQKYAKCISLSKGSKIYLKKNPKRVGTIIGFSRDGWHYRVIWDGCEYPDGNGIDKLDVEELLLLKAAN